jgi:two-component SAPR family response regulator
METNAQVAIQNSSTFYELRAKKIKAAFEELDASLNRQKPHVGQVASAYKALTSELRQLSDEDNTQVDFILDKRFEWTRERRTRVQQRYAKFYTFVQTAQPDKVASTTPINHDLQDMDDKNNSFCIGCRRCG